MALRRQGGQLRPLPLRLRRAPQPAGRAPRDEGHRKGHGRLRQGRTGDVSTDFALNAEGHLLLLQCNFCFEQQEESLQRNATTQPRAKGNSEESEDDVSDDTFDEEDFGRPDDEDLIDDHHVRTSAGAVRGQQRQQHR